MDIYDEILKICLEYGFSFFSTLPCSYNINMIKNLEKLKGKVLDERNLSLIHIPLVREESGVSISAGAYLGGKKTAMVIQNQGLGNMLTQLLSFNSHLNGSYRIPNLYIISHRGLDGEKISAQKPLGIKTKEILDIAGIKHYSVENISDLEKFYNLLEEYRNGYSVALLVKPEYDKLPFRIKNESVSRTFTSDHKSERTIKPTMSRYIAISTVINQIKNEFIVSNIGHPSRELFNIRDRSRNFYLTSSLGQSYTLALGLALTIEDIPEKVIVFEGDGGILMNLGSLIVASHHKPKNLIIIILDNGVYGSTGNLETYSSKYVNMRDLAHSCGFPKSKIRIIADEGELRENLTYALNNEGPFLFHVIITDKYEKVPTIPIKMLEIKERFMKTIQEARIFKKIEVRPS